MLQVQQLQMQQQAAVQPPLLCKQWHRCSKHWLMDMKQHCASTRNIQE
jgi:hypothetical protein